MPIVYKYREANPDGWSVLERGALWLSSPIKFNDSLDMRRCFPRIMESDYPAIERKLVEIKIRQNKGMSVQEARCEAKEALSKGSLYHEIRFGRILVDWCDRVRVDAGVVCFGQSANNDYLWKNYAGSGAGFCIGFDPSLLSNHKVLKVKYGLFDNSDEIRYFESDEDTVREALCLSKEERWRPEEEVRIIVANRADSEMKFDPEAIVAVVSGDKMSEEDSKRLHNLVRNRYGHITVEKRLLGDTITLCDDGVTR